jgi:protein-disulfide isomerase
MKMRAKYLVPLIAATFLAACSGGADPAAPSRAKSISAPSGADWTTTISMTEAGGAIMGNPDAPVKLLEYGALSCPHCAKLAMESHDGLRTYVTKGTVSFEFRPFLIHPQDVPAFLLARCNGPTPYFAISEQMFASQMDWLGKVQNITAQEQQAFQGMTPIQASSFLADKMGLIQFVGQRGVPTAKAHACLADQAALDRLGRITEDGIKQFNITGTPTLIINGEAAGVGDWKALEPLLKAAGA